MTNKERNEQLSKCLKSSIILLLAAMSFRCGGTPTSPTPPAATTFVLTGTVSSAGSAVAGAGVTILDGANANQATTTANDGRFTFPALKAGGFTLRTAAPDYVTTTQPVTLTAATTVTVELTRLPRATLVNVPDALVALAQPDGTFAYAPTGQNTGTGCAGSVAGTTDVNINGTLLRSMAWALPPTTVVRPGERFTYQFCCLTRTEAFTAGVGYFTHFSWVTTGC